MMKKYTAFLSALLLLTAVGCSDTAASQEQETTALKLYIDAPAKITTEAETTQASETSATASVTETAAAEETAAPAASGTETASTASETSAETSAADETVTQAAPVPNDADPAILGTWQYTDGYGFRFMEDRKAEIVADYTHYMHLKDSQMYFDDELYPLQITGNAISFYYNEELFLLLEADTAPDAANLTGRYRLGACGLYDELSAGAGDAVYYVDVIGQQFRLITPIEYDTIDGVLRLVDRGSELFMAYSVDAQGLHLTDSDGVQDLLTRAE